MMLKGESKASWVVVKLWHTSDLATTISKKIDVFDELLDHQICGLFLLQKC